MKSPDFRKYPALFTLIPLASGIFISYLIDLRLSSLQSYYFISFLIVSTLIAMILYPRVREIFSAAYSIFAAVVLLWGCISMQYYYHKIDDNSIYRSSGKFRYSNVNIYGTVAEEPELKNESIRLIVKADSLSEGFNSFNFVGTVLVSVYKNRFGDNKAPEIKAGDVIQLNGRIEELPHRRNPREFDYGEYLKLHGIEAVLYASGYDKIKIAGKDKGEYFKRYIISPVKKYINKVIDENSIGNEREFLRGLLLGDKSNISKETKTDFVNAGVAHIIAVSGLNVAYVLIVLNALMLIVPLPKNVKNVFIILSLLFYMSLTGNSPSIVRATIMAIVFLAARFFERKPNSYNVISFAALIILISDPRQLFDSGFILSFGAILSIIYFNPKLTELLNKIPAYRNLKPERKLNKIIKETALLFTATLAAQIGILPITAIMFKKISIVSLITNIFAIPVSNISLALGFVTVFVSVISSWAAGVFAAFNNFLMYYLLKAISVSAKFDFSFVETYRMDLLLFIIYYAVIFLLFSIHKNNYRSRLVISTMLVLNFAVFESVLGANSNVRLTYLDVGNSNSALISLPGGTNILINTGTSSANYNSAERNVLPYLKREGIKQIDLLVITAMDANELINIGYLANNIRIKKIVMPVHYKSIFERPAVKKEFSRQNIEFIDSSRIINSKGKFRLYLYYNEIVKGNNMLAEFVFGSRRFLFDDNEEEGSENLSLRYLKNNLNVSALRVPQFGSFDLSPPGFIVKSNPSLIIISQKNRQKLVESDAFEEALEKCGFKIASVPRKGAVILETDGTRTKLVDWN